MTTKLTKKWSESTFPELWKFNQQSCSKPGNHLLKENKLISVRTMRYVLLHFTNEETLFTCSRPLLSMPWKMAHISGTRGSRMDWEGLQSLTSKAQLLFYTFGSSLEDLTWKVCLWPDWKLLNVKSLFSSGIFGKYFQVNILTRQLYEAVDNSLRQKKNQPNQKA